MKEQEQGQEQNSLNEREAVNHDQSHTDTIEQSDRETEEPPFLKEETTQKVSNEPATTKDQIKRIP